MILDNGGKAILAIKWQRTWNCFCILVSCGKKMEPASNKIGNLLKEISKLSVKKAAWFLLNAYSKIRGEMI